MDEGLAGNSALRVLILFSITIPVMVLSAGALAAGGFGQPIPPGHPTCLGQPGYRRSSHAGRGNALCRDRGSGQPLKPRLHKADKPGYAPAWLGPSMRHHEAGNDFVPCWTAFHTGLYPTSSGSGSSSGGAASSGGGGAGGRFQGSEYPQRLCFRT